MLKVVAPFFDGNTKNFYDVGLEIADDPALAWAEKRGLVKKIEEEKPKAEAKTEAKKTSEENNSKKMR